LNYKLPSKQKTDICTIMYTSGTTGEPKGVILTNGAIVAQVLSIDRMLLLTDKVVNNQITNYVFLKLNDSVSFLFSIFL
jgi:long-chain acyl-CoA synthetase